MMRRLRLPNARAVRTASVACIMCAAPTVVRAQDASVWLDMSGTHSRPPSSIATQASSYGTLGLRVRVQNVASSFELGVGGGRGVEEGSGGWLNGRGAYDVSRVRGRFDYGFHVDASGLTYISAVDAGDDTEFKQALGAATLRPAAGVSILGMRLGVEGTVTRGVWRTDVTAPLTGGTPFPPVPGPRGGRNEIRTTGSSSIVGGAATLLRIFGPASVQLRGSRYDVRNEIADGTYTGAGVTIGSSFGPADISVGANALQRTGGSWEKGGYAAVGLSLGNGAYLQASASRSVTDLVTGAAGSAGFSVGMSMRLGSGSIGPAPAAAVGAPRSGGRAVRFTLENDDARSVAVAGDFSGWQPRPLSRGDDGEWELELVLDPGVYHYSFVIDGTEWVVPANATGVVDDGFGRKNATIVVATEKEQADS
jgi:hypothetical protein